MKIAVIYFTRTGNTEKQAMLVQQGVSEVEGVEVKTMPINDIDADWVKESRALIFGSPTYWGSCCWQMKRFFDDPPVKLQDKLAGFFATQNWPGGGGADFTLMTMASAAFVHGMLLYSGGVFHGPPATHFGAVARKAPSTEVDRDRAIKLGRTIAEKAVELFG